MFSVHFKRSLLIIAIVTTAIFTGYEWLKYHIHNVIVPRQIALPKNDRETISYNENNHIVSVTTPQGTIKKYSRNPSVEILKSGVVKVNNNQWGAEFRPFLGLGYSDTGRIYMGCDLFYFHQFDASTSFGWTADNRYPAFQPLLAIGWNFYSNTSLNVGVNPIPFVLQYKPEYSIFISVRL